jgi:hypothetical protein
MLQLRLAANAGLQKTLIYPDINVTEGLLQEIVTQKVLISQDLKLLLLFAHHRGRLPLRPIGFN